MRVCHLMAFCSHCYSVFVVYCIISYILKLFTDMLNIFVLCWYKSMCLTVSIRGRRVNGIRRLHSSFDSFYYQVLTDRTSVTENALFRKNRICD